VTNRLSSYRIALIVVASTVCLSWGGSVQSLAINSVVMGTSIAYDVYLPAAYQSGSATARYPVIYLLHWYGGNKSDWQQTGMQQAVDSVGCIAVAPSDGVTTSWWMDAPKIPNQKFCTFLAGEFKSLIDSLYRTLPQKSTTGICGVSMGGYGALNALRRHPDTYGSAFSVVGGVSFLDNNILFGLPSLMGDRTVDSANWIEADIRHNCAQLRGLTFGLNSNTMDGLYQLNLGLHNDLTALNINHVWWTFGLGHNYPFPADMLTIMRWFQNQFSTSTPVSGMIRGEVRSIIPTKSAEQFFSVNGKHLLSSHRISGHVCLLSRTTEGYVSLHVLMPASRDNSKTKTD
jgi:S-formylglutathione hydrolase FrmB